MFITGQSGKGKTFFATNLLPSISLLGGNSIVIDASDSFIRDEVLLAMPEVVVDAMFEFIDISSGQAKMPVNPLFIGDCANLAAKKRRIIGFVKAAAGKLSKEDSRVIAGLISQRLQGHDEISVFTTDLLREILEKGGSAGRNALNLIASVLDDIDAIGCEAQGWGSFFAKHKRIPVILIGDAVGENVHQLVDVLLNSLFEWQHDNKEKPLTITIDEIKRMSFADGSPLHTVLTQGRRDGIRLIGITQDYISNDSHAIDVMKQAGIKVFFEPAKSKDRIAKELGYKDAVDAGLGSMGIGEFIIRSDLYNAKDSCNTQVVIPCSTVKFVNSPLYQRFLREYGITVPQVNPGESSDLSAASQPDEAEGEIEETLPEVMKSESSAVEAQLLQPSEMDEDMSEAESSEDVEPPTPEPTEIEPTENTLETEEPPVLPDSEYDESSDLSEVPQPEGSEAQVEETQPKIQEEFFMPLTLPASDEIELEPPTLEMQHSQFPKTDDEVPEEESSEAEKPEPAEPPTPESIKVEQGKSISGTKDPLAPQESEPDEPKEDPQEIIERELQQQFERIMFGFDPDDPYLQSDLNDLLAQILEKHLFVNPDERIHLQCRLQSLIAIGIPDCPAFREELQNIYNSIWPDAI